MNRLRVLLTMNYYFLVTFVKLQCFYSKHDSLLVNHDNVHGSLFISEKYTGELRIRYNRRYEVTILFSTQTCLSILCRFIGKCNYIKSVI